MNFPVPSPRSAAPPLSLPEPPEFLQQYLRPGTSAVQFYTIFRAYWRQTVWIALSLLVLFAVVLKLLPTTYTATATLMISYEVSQGGKAFPIGEIGSYMATQVELIQSDEVLLPVIDRLALTQDPQFNAGFHGGDGAALRAWVVKNLRDNLIVDQGRGSQLLYVRADAKDPVKAARIANTISDVYMLEERRLVNDPASQRAQEYSAQLAELQAKVTAAQEKVTQFRGRSGITDLTAQNDTTAQSLNSLEQQFLAAQSVRRVAEAKGAGDQDVSSNVLNSQTVQALKGQLATEEAQLAQLGPTLGPQHPKVLELTSQIAATRRALHQEIQIYSSSRTSEVSSGRALEEQLRRAIEVERAKLLTVRQLQDEGANLLLQLDSAQRVYRRALDGYDEIMFNSAGKLTNVSLVSRASVPVTAGKPTKLKLMLLGVAGAVALGFGAPLGYELWFNRRMRCRDDLERDFGIPVLAELDPLPPASSFA